METSDRPPAVARRHRGCSVAALWVCPSLSAEERPPRNVLAVHSGAEDLSRQSRPGCRHSRGLVGAPELPIDYFAEYLESDRFGRSGIAGAR